MFEHIDGDVCGQVVDAMVGLGDPTASALAAATAEQGSARSRPAVTARASCPTARRPPRGRPARWSAPWPPDGPATRRRERRRRAARARPRRLATASTSRIAPPDGPTRSRRRMSRCPGQAARRSRRPPSHDQGVDVARLVVPASHRHLLEPVPRMSAGAGTLSARTSSSSDWAPALAALAPPAHQSSFMSPFLESTQAS